MGLINWRIFETNF